MSPMWLQEPKDFSHPLLLFHVISRELNQNQLGQVLVYLWNAGTAAEGSACQATTSTSNMFTQMYGVQNLTEKRNVWGLLSLYLSNVGETELIPVRI